MSLISLARLCGMCHTFNCRLTCVPKRLAAACSDPRIMIRQRLLEKSRVHVLGPDCCSLTCNNMGEGSPPTLLCGGCRCARYCSSKCQKLAWTFDGHRDVCKIWAKSRRCEYALANEEGRKALLECAVIRHAKNSYFSQSPPNPTLPPHRWSEAGAEPPRRPRLVNVDLDHEHTQQKQPDATSKHEHLFREDELDAGNLCNRTLSTTKVVSTI